MAVKVSAQPGGGGQAWAWPLVSCPRGRRSPGVKGVRLSLGGAAYDPGDPMPKMAGPLQPAQAPGQCAGK